MYKNRRYGSAWLLQKYFHWFNGEVLNQGKIFPVLRPKTRGNEFKKLAIWGTIFVGTERQQIA